MKRFVLTVSIAALASVFLMTGPAMSENLKIGSMSPLTGPYAADGNDIANGVRTAIAVVTAEGGIPGFDKIALSPQDTACDPRQSVAAANKLVNESVSAVIGAYCSSSTIPASEVLDEERILMITPASTNEKVTERGLKYMFRTCGRDDDQSKAAGKFIKDYLKAKTLFLVDDKTTYSQGLADNVAKEAKALGIQVVGHEHVNQGDKDFSAVLTKVKAASPDVFYVSLQNSASGALMLIQALRGVDADPSQTHRHSGRHIGPGCRLPSPAHRNRERRSGRGLSDVRICGYETALLSEVPKGVFHRIRRAGGVFHLCLRQRHGLF